MPITKNKAQRLVDELLNNNEKELVEEKSLIAKILYDIAEKRILADIMEAYNNKGNQPYFYESQNLSVYNKYDKISFIVSDPLPSRSEYGGVNIEVNEALFEFCKGKIQAFEKKRSDLLYLRDQLTGLVYSLRTEKKIVEHFPKLANQFEKKVDTLPACINQLKSQIK